VAALSSTVGGGDACQRFGSGPQSKISVQKAGSRQSPGRRAKAFRLNARPSFLKKRAEEPFSLADKKRKGDGNSDPVLFKPHGSRGSGEPRLALRLVGGEITAALRLRFGKRFPAEVPRRLK